jgi:uncharacterized membrane protein
MREETVMAALPVARPRAARTHTSGGPDTFPGRETHCGKRILCGLLAASAALLFLNVAYMALAGRRSPLLLAAFQIMPVLVVVGHAALAKGWRRAAFFASTCFCLGFLAEVLGVRYGLLFGGHYTYLDVDVACGGVPLIIPVFWVIFIYISYCMLNTFLLFLGKKKPARESGGVPGMLLVIALDGILVVIIDVIMDPVMVKAGKWQWADGGTYHGVPLGNFLGWFVLACLTLLRGRASRPAWNTATQQRGRATRRRGCWPPAVPCFAGPYCRRPQNALRCIVSLAPHGVKHGGVGPSVAGKRAA